MAISVQDQRLVITCSPFSDYETAHAYVDSLLTLLQSVTEENRMPPDRLWYVYELIRELLPSEQEFFELQHRP
ncbi:MAG: hypothetical protein IJC16_00115 [Rikenellaceae bacterium]|nr:hypothetical protein [Rikenellaceae bacterium]